MSKIASVRGMNDLAPEEVRLWTVAEETNKKVFIPIGMKKLDFP